MKLKNLISALFMCCLCLSSCTKETGMKKPTIRFADKSEAEQLISAVDDFSQHLNQFDLDVRLQKTNSTKSEWEQLVKKETMDWNEKEKERVSLAFQTLQDNIDKLNLQIPFPDEIILLKTSMKEELGAGAYTRKNWIAIGENELKLATDQQLAQLMGHELFHVLSRHDGDFKRDVYKTIGFEGVGREISFAPDAMAKRISNPDIARRDSYINLSVDGKLHRCVEFIYASKPYEGGDIFECLNVGFIPLDENFNPLMEDSCTVLFPIAKVADEFKSKIGGNTNYVIDPEEISAEHFSFLLTCKENLPNPEFIDALAKTLQVADEH